MSTTIIEEDKKDKHTNLRIDIGIKLGPILKLHLGQISIKLSRLWASSTYHIENMQAFRFKSWICNRYLFTSQCHSISNVEIQAQVGT